MKTMKWLIRRELWEHKGMFFWAPVIIGAVMVGLSAIMTLNFLFSDSIHATYFINGQRGELSSGALSAGLIAEKAEMTRLIASSYMMVSGPIFILLGGVVFFYCLGALYDERRDRSVLFWKSLPVSDAMTVWSKVAMALVIAPLIAVVVGTLTSLSMVMMFCAVLAAKGANLFGYVLGDPAFYLGPLHAVSLLPVYFLWALPAVCWLLMVSAWARSKVFLWAVGAPLLTAMVVSWANKAFHLGWNTDWFFQHILGRALLGVIPGSWLLFDGKLASAEGAGVDLARVFALSWASLANPGVWIGALAGAAMLYGAIRLRRWSNEA